MAGFTSRQTYNGVSYKVYIPENYNSNTEVLVYCHGGEDTDSNYATHFLKTSGGDTVVIFPTANERFRETNEYGGVVANIVSNVKQELNITNTGLSVAGFSKGSTPAYTTMGEYLKQNPNCSSSTLYLLDNYPNANFSSTVKFGTLLEDYGSYYKNNDTMFVAMIPQWDTSGTYIIGSKQTELDYLAKYGITNVSVLHSYKASYPGSFPNENLAGSSHQCVEQVFWLDGIFNMNNDVSISFNGDQYKLTIYNKNTGQYEITDFNNLNSLDKLRQYFGINISGVSTGVTTLNNGSEFLKDEISKLAGLTLFNTSNSLVKSDKDILLSNVNNVISDIKNTAFVSNGLNLSFSGSSTTKVPSGIPNIIGLYFTFTTNLLTELSTFMNTVATAGESIDNMDKDLEKEASTLNDNVQLNVSDTNNLTATVNKDTSVLDNIIPSSSVTATAKDTKDEVTTVVRNNNTSSGVVSTSVGNTSSNDYVSISSNSNNNDKVTAIPQDTWEEVTTVVRDNNVSTVPNNPVSGEVNTIVSKPNDVISTPVVPSETVTTLPEVDVPKHDIGNLNIGNTSTVVDSEIIKPNIDNVLNNNNVFVPVTNPETVKNNNNVLGSIGVAVGVGGAIGAAGVLAAKTINKNKNKDTDNDEEVSEYKDDYYEEV